MLNISEITNTIAQLESEPMTFESCKRLASLYIVRDSHLVNDKQVDTSSILPHYECYCNIKRRYQMHETDQSETVRAIKDLCAEILNLIVMIYNSTECEAEREQIKKMETALYNLHKQA